MERGKPLVVGAFLLMALAGALPWHFRFTGSGVAPVPDDAASAAVMAEPRPLSLERALAEMRMGLTELRQSAKTGDPTALREAERDVLAALLDGLTVARAGGILDASAYTRVVGGVAEVQGLFREIPYLLVVVPGGDLPEIRLPLRRSPLPAIQARGAGLGWRMATDGDTVTLTPAP